GLQQLRIERGQELALLDRRIEIDEQLADATGDLRPYLDGRDRRERAGRRHASADVSALGANGFELRLRRAKRAPGVRRASAAESHRDQDKRQPTATRCQPKLFGVPGR